MDLLCFPYKSKVRSTYKALTHLQFALLSYSKQGDCSLLVIVQLR